LLMKIVFQLLLLLHTSSTPSSSFTLPHSLSLSLSLSHSSCRRSLLLSSLGMDLQLDSLSLFSKMNPISIFFPLVWLGKKKKEKKKKSPSVVHFSISAPSSQVAEGAGHAIKYQIFSGPPPSTVLNFHLAEEPLPLVFIFWRENSTSICCLVPAHCSPWTPLPLLAV